MGAPVNPRPGPEHRKVLHSLPKALQDHCWAVMIDKLLGMLEVWCEMLVHCMTGQQEDLKAQEAE